MAKLDLYSKTAIGLIGFLLLTIVALIVLNTTTRLHVRWANVETIAANSGGLAELDAQRLHIKFNRPLAKQDFAQFITITPAVELSFVNVAEEVVVVVNGSLASNTIYELKVHPGLTDAYGEQLTESFSHSFRTRGLALFYLVKGQDGRDEIRRHAFADGRTNTIYTANNIVSYNLEGNLLAVVTKLNEEQQTLTFWDTSSQTVKATSPDHLSVYATAFASSGRSNVLYALAKDANEMDDFGQPSGGRFVYTVSLDDFRWEQMHINADIADIDELAVSQDGQALLIKDTINALYYLVDLTDPTNVVSLGKFVGNGGFNYTAQQIAFTEVDILSEIGFPFTSVINADKEKKVVTPPTEFAIDPQFAHNSDLLAWSRRYEEVPNSRGFFEVFVQNDRLDIVHALRLAGLSLELPQFSPDDRYLAVETFTASQLQNLDQVRVLGFQAKPYFGAIKIYDLQTKQFLEINLAGVEPRWQ